MPICAASVRANFLWPFRLNPTDMAASKGVPSLRRLRTFVRHHEPIVPAGNQNCVPRTADRRSARLPGQWPAESPDPVRWESPADVCRPIFWEFPYEEPVKARNCRTVAIDEYQVTKGESGRENLRWLLLTPCPVIPMLPHGTQPPLQRVASRAGLPG